MFLKLLGSLVLLIIAITEKYWGKEISKQIKYKKGIIALLVFSFLFSVITIIVDDISTNSTIENQKTSQIALLRKNDSLKYQLDSLIKIINENEINSGRRNSGLQYKLSELNDKLEPFIKLAVNKYPNLKIDDALLKLEYDLKEQKDKLSIIFEYSDVALLNYFGLPDKVGDFLIESSEISEILKGSYDRIDSMVFFKHDDISISKFKKVISEFPRFPFSYCAMAMALKDKGDPKWKEYVYKAVEILKKTTQISGHHRNHDEALKTLQQILKISK